MKMKHALLAAITAIALPFPALASGVIDNVNGIALDANGRTVRFRALLIDDEGEVERLLPGRYEAPPRQKKLKKGERPLTEKQLRLLNEVPGIAAAIIVILVVVRP